MFILEKNKYKVTSTECFLWIRHLIQLDSFYRPRETEAQRVLQMGSGESRFKPSKSESRTFSLNGYAKTSGGKCRTSYLHRTTDITRTTQMTWGRVVTGHGVGRKHPRVVRSDWLSKCFPGFSFPICTTFILLAQAVHRCFPIPKHCVCTKQSSTIEKGLGLQSNQPRLNLCSEIPGDLLDLGFLICKMGDE